MPKFNPVPAPQWVNIKDNLPTEKGWYLVSDKDSCIDETWISEFYPKTEGNSKPYFSFVGINGCDKPDDTILYYLDYNIPLPPQE